jgi:putative DNA primase/helicase
MVAVVKTCAPLSKMVTIPNNTLLFANGNNFRLVGDMQRRGLIGRLDAEVERPEMREFAFEDPVVSLKRERSKYVVSALTVLRAYIVAGRPMAVQPLGGFEEWSLLVRDALLWLDEADPVTTIELSRAADPQRQNLEAVLTQWNDVLGNRRVSAKEAVEAATAFVLSPAAGNPNHITLTHPEFRAALLAVSGSGDRIDSRRLGHWLGANKQKIVKELRLMPDGILDGLARWRLQRRTNGLWT